MKTKISDCPTLYDALLRASRSCSSVELDHHESDLYVRWSPEALAIVREYCGPRMYSTFRSDRDGLVWIECPFAWTPYWEARAPQTHDASF